MKLKINLIHGQGDFSEEYVELKVEEDADLKYYILTDTTYIDETTVSNKLPHSHWFSSRKVKAGDFVRLHTKSGNSVSNSNKVGTTTYQVYWGLNKAVWNNTGDKAMLFELSNWTSKKAK